MIPSKGVGTGVPTGWFNNSEMAKLNAALGQLKIQKAPKLTHTPKPEVLKESASATSWAKKVKVVTKKNNAKVNVKATAQKTEQFLPKSQPVPQQQKSAAEASSKASGASSQAKSTATKEAAEKTETTHPAVGQITPLKYIQNAHQDDIHAMIAAGSNAFITGSKDGALKLWNQEKLIMEVWKPKWISYEEWISALSPLGADKWISGKRNGYVDLWKNSGQHVASLQVNAATSKSFKCKERNANRVNCIAQDLFSQDNSIFYVGRPTQFTVHRLRTDDSDQTYATTINTCMTSQNDWVYCVTPLAPKKVMVVTGARLDIFEAANKTWKQTALIKEEYSKDTPRHQRPFISCVTHLQNQLGIYGLAVFGGPVTLMNIVTQQPVKTYREHKKRVWTVENIKEHVIASCSDDHTIKIWDVRLAKSALTLSDNIGRVSTLLRLSEHTLISGACPDNLKETNERAQLTFWDIRKV